MAGTDIDRVLEAAALLDIAEVQLFRQAYRHWFGRHIDEVRLDRVFCAYMFVGAVPYWVRDYSRQVLEQAARHRLDPVKFGVVPRLVRRSALGLWMLLAPFAVLAVLVWLADWALRALPGAPSCLFPPCY